MSSKESWMGSDKLWSDVCKKTIESKDFFLSFRQNARFFVGVEGAAIKSGLENILFFKRNCKEVTKSFDLISKSDFIGNPLREIGFKINEKIYNLNPTTLRYAKNTQNLIDLFGLECLKNERIVEIGAGYGGEAKVINDTLKVNTNSPKKSNDYVIFDLKSSEKLISKYLSHFGYEVTFNDIENFDKNLDPYTVISNGALSEMWGELLFSYLEKIVLKARRGYFIVNFDRSVKLGKKVFTDNEFLQYLKKKGKNDARFLDNNLFLTNWDTGKSRLIVFGVPNHRLKNTINERRKLFSYIDIFKIKLLVRLMYQISGFV